MSNQITEGPQGESVVLIEGKTHREWKNIADRLAQENARLMRGINEIQDNIGCLSDGTAYYVQNALSRLLAATDSPAPTQTKTDSITAITCAHHTDQERSEITCPVCLEKERNNFASKFEEKYAQVYGLKDTLQKYQHIITILTEAMANIANRLGVFKDGWYKEIKDIARDALQRADKAGKGESTP